MDVDALLQNIKTLVQKNQEIRSSKGDDFNVFHLCRVDHYETYHSRIIAEFLDPQGSHGFGDAFFRKFCEINEIGSLDYHHVSVKTEVDDGGGDRFDILLGFPDGRIVIENKIYANDQDKQIRRYLRYLKKQTNGRLFYLTLDGRPCQDEDVSAEEYRCLSYKEHILPWLDACILIAAEKPFVRESLRQYRNLIQELTGNTMEAKIMDEITKSVLFSKDNYDAARKIAQCFPDIQKEQYKKLLNDWAKEKARQINETSIEFLQSDQANVTRIAFGNSPLLIGFSFNTTGFRDFYYGLVWKDEATKNNSRHFSPIDGWKQSDWWPCWKYFADKYRHPVDSPEFLFEEKEMLYQALDEAFQEVQSLQQK